MDELQATDALTVTAEIAIGLAGFSGLIVTLRNRGLDHWPANDRVRLRFMLRIACSTFFAALLPFLLAGLAPWDATRAWYVSSLLLGAGLLLLFTLIFRETWPIRRQLSPLWFWLYLVGTLLASIVVLLGGMEVLGIRTIGGYLIGLYWMLFASTSLFVRLILNEPSS